MEGEDLGGRGTPLERGVPLPPNLPFPPRTSPKSTRLFMAKSCFVSHGAGALGGSFCRLGRCRVLAKCGCRACLVCGGVRFCKCCASAGLSPLISRLRRQLPPEGKPSRNPFGFHNEINKVRRSRSFCVWGAVGYNALHERRALYCRERPVCRSVSIGCNLS